MVNHTPQTRNLMIPPSPSRRLCWLVSGVDVLVRELEASPAGWPPDRAVGDVRPAEPGLPHSQTLVGLTAVRGSLTIWNLVVHVHSRVLPTGYSLLNENLTCNVWELKTILSRFPYFVFRTGIFCGRGELVLNLTNCEIWINFFYVCSMLSPSRVFSFLSCLPDDTFLLVTLLVNSSKPLPQGNPRSCNNNSSCDTVISPGNGWPDIRKTTRV